MTVLLVVLLEFFRKWLSVLSHHWFQLDTRHSGFVGFFRCKVEIWSTFDYFIGLLLEIFHKWSYFLSYHWIQFQKWLVVLTSTVCKRGLLTLGFLVDILLYGLILFSLSSCWCGTLIPCCKLFLKDQVLRG